MNSRKMVLLLVFFFLLLMDLYSDTGIRKGYGDSMGINHFVKYRTIEYDFNRLWEEKDIKKSMANTKEILEENPKLARGYYHRLITGLLKKDLPLVQKGLQQMTDKYVAVPDLYRKLVWLQKEVGKDKKDAAFHSGVKAAIDKFFKQREAYLLGKLKYKMNRRVIYKELALIKEQVGDEEGFVGYLKKLLVTDYSFVNSYVWDRKGPKYKLFNAMMAEFEKKRNVWNGTDKEKVEGLMRVASEIAYWSAALDFSEIGDWNAHVASYIPRALATRTRGEYYDVLTEIVGKIGDDHTWVRVPKSVESLYSGCGLDITYASGKILIKGIHRDSLKGKFKIGDEIVAIDGTPALDYLEKNKRRYPFPKYAFAYNKIHFYYKASSSILVGLKDSTVELALRRPDGKTFSTSLVRDSYKEKIKDKIWEQRIAEKNVELKVLKGNIYQLRIKKFWGSDVYREFLDIIKGKDTSKVKGLIIDLRDNSGGMSRYGDSIFAHLTHKLVKNYTNGYYPIRNPRQSSHGALGYLSLYKGGRSIRPTKEQRFDCPIVVLVSPRTSSAGEDFLSMFKLYKRGILVGQPSSGGTGMGHEVLLPGGGGIRICLNVDLFFTWHGVQPDHFIDYTPRDLEQGKDPYVKKALQLLGK